MPKIGEPRGVRLSVAATLVAAIVGSIGAGARAQEQAVELPGTMIWTAYDVGSSGYVEASGVADALIKEYGTRIRILPSGTSIGRLLPLKAERADYGWLANEVYFATEALYDFAARDWGPQDLRIIAGRPGSFGLATAADAGIETLADLEGKRVAYIQANPSVNIKVEALLAFADLTWDDVQRVEFPSYGQALQALIEDQVDAAGTTPTAAALYELQSSPRGIAWPDLPPDDEQAWQRLQRVAPFFAPQAETIGAGLSEEDPAQLMSYRYPMITVYADADEQEVYNLIKAFDATYDLYKDVNPVMASWRLSDSGIPPADAPFHPGAIRYLNEKGIWTDEHNQWNEERLARMAEVRKAWEEATAEAESQGVSDQEWPAFWEEYRKEALGSS